MNRRSLSASAVAVALAAGLAACGSSGSSDNNVSGSGGSSKSGDKSPIVIGATFGLTGPMSFYDQPMVQGMSAAIRDVNAKGGIDGRQVKLITNDNQSDVNKLVQQAQAMVAKKPTLMVVSSSNTTGGPAARVGQAAGQLTMGAAGNTILGKTGVGPLVFNDWHGDATEAAALATFMEKKSYDSVYIAQDMALDYTQDVCKYFEKSYKGKILGKVTYNSTTDQSFNSQVSKIRGAAGQAKAIMICGLATGGPALIKQLRSVGVSNPIIGTGGGMDGDFWTKSVPNLGTFYSDSVGSIYGDDAVQERNDLVARITKETGKAPPTGHIFIAYSIVQMLQKAIELNGGKTDSASLAKAYEKLNNFPTNAGNTTYTASCHVPLGRSIAITQIVGGKGKFVEAVTPTDTPAAPC